MRRQETIIVVMALIGVLLSAYALPLHYKDGASICDLGDTLNCDKVNKSPWSEFLGVPVALLGLIAYATVALLVVKRGSVQRITGLTPGDFWQYLFLLTLAMALFQAYLTMTEALFIHAFCIICLASQAVVLTLATLAWREWKA